MSFQYDQYLARHRANVKRGFDWLSENLPGLMTNAVQIGRNRQYARRIQQVGKRASRVIPCKLDEMAIPAGLQFFRFQYDGLATELHLLLQKSFFPFLQVAD